MTVHIDALIAAFRRATDRFFAAIEREPDLEKVVWHRAHRYYDEVRVFGVPGDDGSWVESIPTVYV